MSHAGPLRHWSLRVARLAIFFLSPHSSSNKAFLISPILTLISSTGWPLRLLFPLACPATTPTPCFLRLLVLALYLRPAVLSTVMDSFPEHNSSQASQAEPTIEEIKNWDEDDLLKWIQQRHPKLLEGDDLKKLKGECVDGVVFLNHAGDKKYFHEECNLASGTSERLANLARMVQKWEQDTSTGKSTPRHASHADVHCPRWLRHTC